MNKSELVDALAEKMSTDTNKVSKASAARFLDAFQDVVIDTVAGGDEVKLTGFMAASPATRSARTMKNPRTGEDIQVPETKTVRLRPLKRFRDSINGN